MPKRINYTLTEKELKQVEQAIKNHPDLRLRERARIIRLLHLGHKHQEVAHLLGISPSNVYWWHQRWRQEGLEGLSDRPRSGRPKVGGEAYRAKLEEVLNSDPHTLGLAFTVWGVPQLLPYMEAETGIGVHPNTLRNMLAELGYVYRRPKHDLSNLQDAEAKEAARQYLEELKKSLRPGDRTFLCGRNDAQTHEPVGQVLDEARSTATGRYPRHPTLGAPVWRLQLAHRRAHHPQGGQEAFRQLLPVPPTPDVRRARGKTHGVSAGQCLLPPQLRLSGDAGLLRRQSRYCLAAALLF